MLYTSEKVQEAAKKLPSKKLPGMVKVCAPLVLPAVRGIVKGKANKAKQWVCGVRSLSQRLSYPRSCPDHRMIGIRKLPCTSYVSSF